MYDQNARQVIFFCHFVLVNFIIFQDENETASGFELETEQT